jgi:hypothetical protein
VSNNVPKTISTKIKQSQFVSPVTYPVYNVQEKNKTNVLHVTILYFYSKTNAYRGVI